MKLSILQFSDLHMSKGKEKQAKRLADALLRDVERIKQDTKTSPDLVLFSGDLVQAGSDGVDAFLFAHDCFIEPVMKGVELIFVL